MATFGNTGASSLLRAATTAYNKKAAYDDQEAAFRWDLSEKSAEDYAAYKKYLDGRVAKAQNSDPSKALSLTRTAVSANRNFNSAEISRATTSVKYGTMSNRDKYGKLNGLMQAALSNGDENLAQRLEGQMSSLSITIQNEEEAAARKAEAGSNKAMSSNKKQLDAYVRDNFDTKIKEGLDLVEKGEMSVQTYLHAKATLLEGKRAFLEEASTGKYGSISDDAMSSYADKASGMALDDSFKKAQADGSAAAAGITSKYLKVDPLTKRATLEDNPNKPSFRDDGKGNIIPVYKQDSVWGSNDTKAKREAAVENGTANYIFGQTAKPMDKGPEGEEIKRDNGGRYYVTASGQTVRPDKTSEVGGTPVADGKGGYYVVDAQGRKHGVTTDPNAPLQRWRYEDGTEMPNFGPTTGAGQLAASYTESGIGKLAVGTGRAIGRIYNTATAGLFDKAGGFINNLVNGDYNARLRQAKLLEAQQAMARAKRADELKAGAAAPLAPKRLLPAVKAFVAPKPAATTPQGAKVINKVLTQAVPTNKNGTVNAPAAATKLLTGLGFGNF